MAVDFAVVSGSAVGAAVEVFATANAVVVVLNFWAHAGLFLVFIPSLFASVIHNTI